MKDNRTELTRAERELGGGVGVLQRLYHYSRDGGLKDFKGMRGEEARCGVDFTRTKEESIEGESTGYVYTCIYKGDSRSVLELGRYDGLYRTGERVYMGEIEIMNEARREKGMPKKVKPIVDMTSLDRFGCSYLRGQGYGMVTGQEKRGEPRRIIVVMPGMVEIESVETVESIKGE